MSTVVYSQLLAEDTEENAGSTLRLYLDPKVFEWLCALAVYPELQWELTVELGRVVDLNGSVYREPQMLQLIRLAWFRQGWIPGSWRVWLVKQLDPKVERNVREFLLKTLSENRAPAGSYARDWQDVQIAAQRHCLDPEDATARADLDLAMRALPAVDLNRDALLRRLREQWQAQPITQKFHAVPRRAWRDFLRGRWKIVSVAVALTIFAVVSAYRVKVDYKHEVDLPPAYVAVVVPPCWIYWAGIHGYPRYLSWNHGRVGDKQFPYDLFLPWHRAYLLSFEHTMRDWNAASAIPWWDCTTPMSHKIGIPNSFAQPKIAGRDNPLFHGPMPAMQKDPARFTVRSPEDPASLPTPEDVEFLMTLSSFGDFSNQVENISNGVHGWIGGDMGIIKTGAFDPLLWAHACFVDRLWYLWQLRHGVNNITAGYLDKILAPFGLTVRDVLDITKLGYKYAGN